MKQRDLAAQSGLSGSMVSRMFENLNRRGDTFDLTERMVVKIAAGLCIGVKGYLILMEAAFPEYFEPCDTAENPQGCPWQIHFARRNGIPGILV